MARTSVAVMPLIIVKRRRTDKVGDAAWNPIQKRMPTAFASSPRLLAYRSCIAREMKKAKGKSLKEVQEAFKAAAATCKSEAASQKTIPKKGGVPLIFA